MKGPLGVPGLTHNATRPNSLGHSQRHVLLVLSTRGASAITDWAAFHPLSESQVRGAMARLGQRKLVDVAGFDGRARTYQITEQGEKAIEGMLKRFELEGSVD